MVVLSSNQLDGDGAEHDAAGLGVKNKGMNVTDKALKSESGETTISLAEPIIPLYSLLFELRSLSECLNDFIVWCPR
jgi:hypothetical protein